MKHCKGKHKGQLSDQHLNFELLAVLCKQMFQNSVKTFNIKHRISRLNL